MHRSLRLVVMLARLVAAPVAAQGAAEEPRPLGALGGYALATPARPLPPLVARAVVGAMLASRYELHVVSDWPQYGIPGTSCVNGGQEVLNGTLSRLEGDSYGGTLERRTTIRFCGSHGQAQDQACSLTLTSHGPVEARGEVIPGAGPGPGATLALRWTTPADAAPDDIAIEGTCAPAFTARLRALYQGVSHAMEVPVPLLGEAPTLVRLEQGWIVEAR